MAVDKLVQLVAWRLPPDLWAADRLQRPLGHWPKHTKAKRHQFECHMLELEKSHLFRPSQCTACGTQFPNQGSNLCPLHCKCNINRWMAREVPQSVPS